MQTHRTERETQCPQCGAMLPVFPGYVTWCDRCSWGLAPRRPQSNTRLDRIRLKLGAKMEKELYEKILPREDFPALYALIDRIADALGSPYIDELVVDADFNASYEQRGWKRRRIVTIGVPLFALLGSEQRIAILAHEVGHGVNGDAMRGVFVASAMNSLLLWHELLRPAGIFSSESGMPGIVMAPVNLLMLGLAQLAYGGAYLLSLLLYRNSQRAEYLADYLASTVCSTDVAVAALEKLHFGDTFRLAAQRAALNRDGRMLLDEFHLLMKNIPEREIERIRRVEMLEGSRLDASHPPTPLRIGFLSQRRVERPKVELSSEEALDIDRELAGLSEETHRRAVEEYRARLYA